MKNVANKFHEAFLKNVFYIFNLLLIANLSAFGSQVLKQIRNPSEPLFGEVTYDLVEDLSIGREDDENYAFFKGADLTVDHEGNFYVFDRANMRVQKFDKNGKFLLTIGRRGQGPGDFQTFNGFFIDSDNNLYVGQYLSIKKFGPDGKLSNTIVSKMPIFSFMVTREHNAIISTLMFNQETNKSTNYIILIDPLGKIIKNIAAFENKKIPTAGNVPVGYFNLYKPNLFFRPIDYDLGVYGYSSEYRLNIINSRGEAIRVIEKNEKPAGISKKEKEEIIENEKVILKEQQIFIEKKEITEAYDFNMNKSFFLGIVSDDLGNIYALKTRYRSDGKREPYFDLFSKSGKYIFRVLLSQRGFPSAIANGCVYIVNENTEAGLYEIKRYKIRNWAQIEDKLTNTH